MGAGAAPVLLLVDGAEMATVVPITLCALVAKASTALVRSPSMLLLMEALLLRYDSQSSCGNVVGGSVAKE